MAFELKDFAAVEAALIAQLAAMARELTDFTEGAVARAILGSVATELQRQNVAAFQGIREGIEVGTYRNFAFTRLPATRSGGIVRFTRPASFGGTEEVIDAGVRVKVPGSAARIYEVKKDVLWLAGALTVDATVSCVTAGTVGNTAKNTVVELLDTLGVLATVTNPKPFLTGLDDETDADRRERFRQFIAGLSRGTKVALEFAARSAVLTAPDGTVTERATGVLVREPFLDDPTGFLGRAEIYVDNGSGTASQALLDQVRDIVRGVVGVGGVVKPGWIAAGIGLKVLPVVAEPLDVVATVRVLPGFSMSAAATAVKAAIISYLRSLQVFQSAVHAELVSAAMVVDGISDVTFSLPTGNVAVAFDRRITPGSLVITAVAA